VDISIEDLRFRQLVGHLHDCGPRALGEFLVELNASGGYGREIALLLIAYEKVDLGTLAALRGGEWPSR
jgi:hypothetical protein